MTALFNSLKRGKRYRFQTISGAFTAVFHEILPDGTLLVGGGDDGKTGHVNPANVVAAWERLSS